MKTHAEPQTPTPSRTPATPVPNALTHQAQLRNALLRAGVQPRLEIGAVNDPLEREADAAAERVIRMPSQAAQANLVQTKASPTSTTQPSPQLESSLNSLNSGGTPLDATTRAFFEPRFGQDFSQVRLHTDASAAQMAESLNAKAFTLGNDIAFGANQYSGGTLAGRGLLGHELAHVVQQGGGGRVVRGKWVQRLDGNASNSGVAQASTSSKVIALISYSLFSDWEVTKRDELQVLKLLKNDTDLSATIVEIMNAGMLKKLLNRVDEFECRFDLLRLLDERLSSEARALVNTVIKDLTGIGGLTYWKNLHWAESAIDFVKSKLKLGAGNKGIDVLRSSGQSRICVYNLREKRKQTPLKPIGEQIRIDAETAIKAGCGNCAEQARIAFVFLDDQGVRPIELFWFSNNKDYDHEFVVIERLENSKEDDPYDWGPNAVICDPWLGKAYLASWARWMWHQYWPGGNPQVLHSKR